MAKPEFIHNRDFYLEVQKGNIPNHSIIHKFGKNSAVGTNVVPVTNGGIYNTPQVSGATTLRIKAGNVNDTALGSGAREISITGIDETGSLQTEILATAGASASASTTVTFIRLVSAFVSGSGTYATQSIGSHAADVVIENGAGGTDWGIIQLDNFPASETEIGAYTIPFGYTGYFLSAYGFSESTKTTELTFFVRSGILETAPPYQAMRVLFEEYIQGGEFTAKPKAPIFMGTACDVGFLAKIGVGTAKVDVDFEILLVKNE